MKTIRLTGAELYDLVWTEPVTKIAARFNLSDVGMRKICTRHCVPLPGRGYWQRLAAGRRVARTALPSASKTALIRITIRPQETKMDKGAWLQRTEVMEAEAKPENRIVVPDVIQHPHAVTQATLRALKASWVDRYGAIRCKSADAFSVRVAPSSMDRALRLVDTLVKACANRGIPVKPGKDRGSSYANQASFVVNENALGLSLEERFRSETHKLTVQEIAEQKRRGHTLAPKYDYLPTGELTLKILAGYGFGLRSKWADTRRQRIESCLNEVIVGLLQASAFEDARRLEADERQKRLDAEHQRREALRRQIEDEREAVARLEQAAKDWHRAKLIREYVAAVEAQFIAQGGESDGDKARWISWARAQADRFDPLCETPPSILDTDERDVQPLHRW